MEKKLTKEETAALAPYELELLSAKDGYLRSAGREGLAIMHGVYERVEGKPYTETDACGSCQLTLQKLVADWYYGTKDAEKAEAPKKAPAKKGGKK